MRRTERPHPTSLLHGVLLVVPSAMIALYLVRLVRALCAEISARNDLPQWDMAKYALDGIHLADACRQLDPFSFAGHLHGMSIWPPLFPLIQVPALLLFGYDYAVPRFFVLALFTALVGAVLWAGQALDDRDGLAIGVLAAGCLAASPLYQVFASLVMLEVPGALLLILCLGAYWRADAQTSSPAWRATCALSTALFFCKYNYGVMWLLPLALSELSNRATLRERLRRRLRELWDQRGSGWWRRPWNLFLLAWTAIILIILLTGGIAVQLGELKIRATSIGNPLFILMLLILFRCLLSPRRLWRRGRAWWAGLELRDRTFVTWVVLPIALWLLVPPHVKDFVGFLENRSSGRSLLDPVTWLYYPRILVELYTPLWLTAGAGVVAAVLAMVSRPRGSWSQAFLRLDWRRRALFLTLGVGWLAISLHPYKLPRFLFTSLPLFWLAGGAVLALAVRALLPASPRAALLLISLASGLGVWAVLAPGSAPDRLRHQLAAHGVPASVAPVLDQIVVWTTASSRVASSGETTVLGAWNLLSPPLIEWHLHAALEGSAGAVPAELALTRQLARRRSPELLRQELFAPDGAVRQMILIEALPEAPWHDAFSDETAWLEPLRQELVTAPSFVLFAARSFPTAGYRLRLFVRRDSVTSFL